MARDGKRSNRCGVGGGRGDDGRGSQAVVPTSHTVYCLMEARPLNSDELLPLVDRDAPVATSLHAKVHCLLPCALHA